MLRMRLFVQVLAEMIYPPLSNYFFAFSCHDGPRLAPHVADRKCLRDSRRVERTGVYGRICTLGVREQRIVPGHCKRGGR